MRQKKFELLLIEDNDMDAILVERVLKNMGLLSKYMRVKDGAEAIDFLFARGKYSHRNKNTLPKLILLDLNLPYIHGKQVLENIRRNEQTANIPVIVLTAFGDNAEGTHLKKLGINNFVTKPLDEEKFRRAVSEIELYWYFLNRPPAIIPAQ